MTVIDGVFDCALDVRMCDKQSLDAFGRHAQPVITLQAVWWEIVRVEEVGHGIMSSVLLCWMLMWETL